jgi:hypothetical protein
VIIEPVGPDQRGRFGRARTLAAIALPLVMLVGVVATGVLGRDPGAVATVADDVSASTTPSVPGTSVGPPEPSASTALEADVDFPSRVLGLPVRSVEGTLSARRAAGAAAEGLIAVRGYLTVQPGVERCVVDEPGRAVAALCERATILRDIPDPALAWRDGEVAWVGIRGTAHLHPRAFPGVSLGMLDVEAVTGMIPESMVDGPITPIPAVLIGRFDDPRLADRRASARHRTEGFALERLVWLDGEGQERRVVPSAPDDTTRRIISIVSQALPSGTIALSHTVATVTTLAAIDPTAAAAVRSADGTGTTDDASDEPVWYVRVMTRDAPPVDTLADSGGPRRLGWVVVAGDGSVLGLDRDG